MLPLGIINRMVYLVCCVEPSIARYSAKKLLNKEFPTRDEWNYVSFNMADSSLSDLCGEVEFLPLGVERKAIYAEDCAFLKKAERGSGKKKKTPEAKVQALADYCAHPNEQIDLFLVLYEEAPDEKNPIVEGIKAGGGQIITLDLPKEADFVSFAKRYCEKHNCPCEKGAAEELAKRVGTDYGSFRKNLEKLVAYANGEPVTLQAVKKLVPPKLEDNTFAMSDALTRGKVPEAIRIYRDLKIHGVDEIRLINMLANQFRFFDSVAFLDAKGMGAQAIARELKSNPKRVEITLRNLYHVKRGSLKKIQEELYQTEASILSGKEKPEFAFERFLANFAL